MSGMLAFHKVRISHSGWASYLRSSTWFAEPRVSYDTLQGRTLKGQSDRCVLEPMEWPIQSSGLLSRVRKSDITEAAPEHNSPGSVYKISQCAGRPARSSR